MKMDDIKHGFGSLWDTVAEGWNRLRDTAGSALTRFRAGDAANLPPRNEIDDAFYLPSHAWAMIGGDVFEDERRVMVRLEVPGMERKDFHIEVLGDTLTVRGEKRFERESSEGRWRMLQCAYGNFHRNVQLPAPVKREEARATYRDGVLRIELPKAEVRKPHTVEVKLG
jgi:HSP20 family protein